MEKLTLKEIAGYLPYGLKVLHIDTDEFEQNEIITELETASVECLTFKYGADFYFENSDVTIKPFLYPLEMLTKTIVHNGVEIIPIVELAKISIGLKNIQNIKIDSKFLKVNFETHREDYSLFINKAIDFYLTNISLGGSINTRICNQKELFEKLYEWHFDIQGLIPRGLAVSKSIDKSTLNSK